MTKSIAIGYVRVSTLRQAESGLGLEAQRTKIHAAAALGDFNLVEIIEDAGESGKDLDRPGMTQLLKLIAIGRVDVVIISKLDRITRSTADLARLIDLLQRAPRADGARGVDFVSCSESLDTSTASGRLVLSIIGAISHWERESTAERIRDALRAKRDRGECAGEVPFGFLKLEDGKLVDNEHEQEILDAIKQHRDAGLSWAKVQLRINSAGHRNRRGRDFSRDGLFKLSRNAGIT